MIEKRYQPMSAAVNNALKGTDGDVSAETPDHRLFVAGVAKAFAVLDAFTDEDSALSLNELSTRSGIGRSATQRFVYTLKILGYIQQDPASRRYRLTPRLLHFANAYLRNDPLISRAFPYLREASRRTGETVNLTRLDGAEIVFVTRFPSSTIISADLVLGSRLPAFCTAPGRAMLAYVDHNRVMAVLENHPRNAMTEHTITEIDGLTERLEIIRRQGFEIAVEETFIGDISIAAPVRGEDGNVVAAVNIAVAKPRWSKESASAGLAPIVTETAAAISAGRSAPFARGR